MKPQKIVGVLILVAGVIAGAIFFAPEFRNNYAREGSEGHLRSSPQRDPSARLASDRRKEAPDKVTEFDLSSFNGMLLKIEETNDNRKKLEMIEYLVASYGRAFGFEILEFLNRYEPASDSRTPKLRLAIMNVPTDMRIIDYVLKEFAPGKDRDALLRASLGGASKENIMELLNQIIENGYKEDEFEIARQIGEENALGRQDITSDDLFKMLKASKYESVSRAIVSEIARRELVGLGSNRRLSDAKSITPRIPENYRKQFEREYYAKAILGPVEQSINELEGEGVPSEILNEYVDNFARRQSGLVGPARAISEVEGVSGELKIRYLKIIFRDWLRSDSIGASGELVKMKPGVERDHLILELVNFSREAGDLTAASSWVDQIEARDLKDQGSRMIMSASGDRSN
jgi:hypothetical protein